jgi:hypothetical protein
LGFHIDAACKKMELDRNLADEEPDASWSENTTPGSDDIEEIVRQEDDPPRPRSKNLGTFPRYVRPAIRRRLNRELAADTISRNHSQSQHSI